MASSVDGDQSSNGLATAAALMADIVDDASRVKILDPHGGEALFSAISALNFGVPGMCERRFTVAAALRDVDRRIGELIATTSYPTVEAPDGAPDKRVRPVRVSAAIQRLAMFSAAADAANGHSSRARGSAEVLLNSLTPWLKHMSKLAPVSAAAAKAVPLAYGGPLATADAFAAAEAAAYIMWDVSFVAPLTPVSVVDVFEGLAAQLSMDIRGAPLALGVLGESLQSAASAAVCAASMLPRIATTPSRPAETRASGGGVTNATAVGSAPAAGGGRDDDDGGLVEDGGGRTKTILDDLAGSDAPPPRRVDYVGADPFPPPRATAPPVGQRRSRRARTSADAATSDAPCAIYVARREQGDAFCERSALALSEQQTIQSYGGLLTRTLSGAPRVVSAVPKLMTQVCEAPCDGAIESGDAVVVGVDARVADRGQASTAAAVHVALEGRRLARRLLTEASVALPCVTVAGHVWRVVAAQAAFVVAIIVTAFMLMHRLTRIDERLAAHRAADVWRVVDAVVGDIVEHEVDAVLALLQPPSYVAGANAAIVPLLAAGRGPAGGPPASPGFKGGESPHGAAAAPLLSSGVGWSDPAQRRHRHRAVHAGHPSSRTIRDAQAAVLHKLRSLRTCVRMYVIPHLPPSMWAMPVVGGGGAAAPTARTAAVPLSATVAAVPSAQRAVVQTPVHPNGPSGSPTVVPHMVAVAAAAAASVDAVPDSALSDAAAVRSGGSQLASTVREMTVAVIALPLRYDAQTHAAVETSLSSCFPSERGTVQYLSPTEIVVVWPQASRQAANAVAAVLAASELITSALAKGRDLPMQCTDACTARVLCRSRALRGEFGAGVATTFAASGYFENSQRTAHVFGPAVDEARALAGLALVTGVGVLATDACMMRGGGDRVEARPFDRVAMPTQTVVPLEVPQVQPCRTSPAPLGTSKGIDSAAGADSVGSAVMKHDGATDAGGARGRALFELDALIRLATGDGGSVRVFVVEGPKGRPSDDCEWMYSAAVAGPSPRDVAYSKAFNLLAIGGDAAMLSAARDAALRVSSDYLTRRLAALIGAAIGAAPTTANRSRAMATHSSHECGSTSSRESGTPAEGAHGMGPGVHAATPRSQGLSAGGPSFSHDLTRRRLPLFTPWHGDMYAVF